MVKKLEIFKLKFQALLSLPLFNNSVSNLIHFPRLYFSLDYDHLKECIIRYGEEVHEKFNKSISTGFIFTRTGRNPEHFKKLMDLNNLVNKQSPIPNKTIYVGSLSQITRELAVMPDTKRV